MGVGKMANARFLARIVEIYVLLSLKLAAILKTVGEQLAEPRLFG
jgi:hypothetical protein